MKRVLIALRVYSVALVSFLLLMPTSMAFAYDASFDITNDSVSAGVRYYQDPDTSQWTSLDVGIPDDPRGYRFKLACFDDVAGDVDCLYSNRDSCTAGEGGRLVFWFSGLKTEDPNLWSRVSETPTCIYSEEPVDVGEEIQRVILSAFQEQPIAAGTLTLQPSPHTLIGTETNIFVDATEQTFDMTLLGQDIRIIATPSEYSLDYGDGTSLGPSPVSGGSLPEQQWGEQTQTSHVYSSTGDFTVAATVNFSGQYSINGGPMVPIDGRASVAAEPQSLSVWRAETRSVADDCLVNPRGVGC